MPNPIKQGMGTAGGGGDGQLWSWPQPRPPGVAFQPIFARFRC